MRPLISGLLSGALVALINRFVDGLVNELVTGLVIGGLTGLGVLYAMRPRKPKNVQEKGDST